MTKPIERHTGFPCPKCGAFGTAVKDSRSTVTSVRRRRQCLQCYSRFTTFEIVRTTEHDKSKTVASALKRIDKAMTFQRNQIALIVKETEQDHDS